MIIGWCVELTFRRTGFDKQASRERQVMNYKPKKNEDSATIVHSRREAPEKKYRLLCAGR
jgi:hypothetical protein